ncbi:ABC transporter ATP-binding protein [Bradyrhizobium quebecense]|uniref:ABC transporter ATP-binding protein n=2 Tax=Bradyrhizobium quebecense TaxID=2748629 RepID=A0ABS3MT88_9BRAD|nr:ABC transporter ATP-binding protein [Bradyrhizobium quebecense]UGY02517.1 ABC transporter ATP-binding protein [Bradyrhizobium quebecense]
MTATDLEIKSICVHRVGLPVVKNVSMSVPAGEITVLLGPNGAGRTTLLEAISGLLAAQAGSIRLGQHQIERMSIRHRNQRGLGHVEQGRAVFGLLTVEENLIACCQKSEIGSAYKWFPELLKRRGTLASMLSGGEQQMLVIARALLCQPKILMIDEMSLGLAPVIVQRLLAALKEMSSQGLGVLLVEQFAHLALACGTRAYVMSGGEIVLADDCGKLAGDVDRLHAAYLS